MKTTKIIIGLFLLVLPVFSSARANAQTPTENRGAAEQTAVAAKPSKSGKLSLNAKVESLPGVTNAAANVQFYLLDAELGEILKDSGMIPVTSLGRAMMKRRDFPPVELYAMLRFTARLSPPRNGDLYEINLADKAVKAHTVAQMTTDKNGKGKFPPTKPGKYYLFGVGNLNQAQVIVWNLPIELKAGGQKIVLDRKNAAVIY